MFYNLLKRLDGLWIYLVESESQSDRYQIQIFDEEHRQDLQWVTRIEISGRGQRVVVFDEVYVLPRYRETGLGKLIVETAIDHVLSESGQVIELSCYNNVKSFYTGLGFKTLYEIPKKPGDEDFGGFCRMVYPDSI